MPHADPSTRPDQARGLGHHRLNALVDAVFAISMTLLAIELTDALPESGPLRDHARELLLKLFAFVVGFLILGLFWSTHQAQSHFVERTDRVHTWLKIVFLLFVSLIPVAASLLGTRVEEQSTVLLYGLTLSGAAAANYALWSHAGGRGELMRDGTPHHVVRAFKRRMAIVLAAYAVIMAVSFWNAIASVALFVVIHVAAIFIRTVDTEAVGDTPA